MLKNKQKSTEITAFSKHLWQFKASGVGFVRLLCGSPKKQKDTYFGVLFVFVARALIGQKNRA